jgi:hypothetical protein
MGAVAAAKLPLLIAADRGLARLAGREAPAPVPADRRAVVFRLLADLPRRLLGRLRPISRRQ